MSKKLIEALKKGKFNLGLNKALKGIRDKKITSVYVASNSQAKDKLISLGKTFQVEVILADETSKEMGVLCKKPFSVSVISFE